LVYIPTEEEIENDSKIDLLNLTLEQKYRLFLVNDFSSTCYFRPNHVAKAIAPKEVDMNFDVSKSKLTGSYDIKTASFDGKQIKDICIKLDVNRLGQIVVNNK
jgi:CRISPR-associated endonuclease Csn1